MPQIQITVTVSNGAVAILAQRANVRASRTMPPVHAQQPAQTVPSAVQDNLTMATNFLTAAVQRIISDAEGNVSASNGGQLMRAIDMLPPDAAAQLKTLIKAHVPADIAAQIK